MLSCLLLGKIALVGQLTEYFECGTESNFPNLMAGISMPDASAIMMTESVPLTVRLYLHIMRQSDGTGGRSDEEIATALNNLYSVYSPHGIFFEVGCIDYIDNDDAYCDPAIDPLFPYVTTDNALNVYKNFPIHSDGIDAFIFCPLNGEAHWSGRAPTIPSAVFSVMGLNSDPSIDGFTSMTFAHEIGHCFGLFHTHYGTCNDGVPGTPDGLGGIICAELPVPLGMEDASFANGAICGDYLADTRASKMLDSRDMDCSSAKTRSCEDVPPTEYPYIPQLDNIMSYKHPNCITNLTSGQGYRARWHLQNVPILQACLVQSVTPMPIDIVIEPGTTVWDGEYNIAITQNVIIPDGATLRIENTRRTFQGSQLSITVQKGGVLHLNNSTLMAGYGCNGSSWQGIRVEGSNTPHPSDYLTNGSSEHGIVIVEHNSSIQNATIGILAYQEEGMGLAGLGGGIIYANESTFKNNQTAISIMPHIQTQRSQISECYFINEMPFLNANGTINTEPYCQILLWGSGPVAITDNVFETASTQIGIQGTGIRAIDADVRIGVDSAGETLGNLFSNVFRGVDIYGFFSAAAATHVRGCQFNGVKKGITLSGTTATVIAENTLIVPPGSPFLNYETYAIHAEKSYAYQIRQNSIQAATTHNIYSKGLVLKDSYVSETEGNAHINDNLFSGTFRAATFIEGNNSQVILNCNHYTNNPKNDWYLNETAMIDWQGECDLLNYSVSFANDWNATPGAEQVNIRSYSTHELRLFHDYNSHANEVFSDIPDKVIQTDCSDGNPNYVSGACAMGYDGGEWMASPNTDCGADDDMAKTIAQLLEQGNKAAAKALLQCVNQEWAYKILVGTYVSSRELDKALLELDKISNSSSENMQFKALFQAMIAQLSGDNSSGKADWYAQVVRETEAQGGMNGLLAQSTNAALFGNSYVRTSAPLKTDEADSTPSPAFVVHPNPATVDFRVDWRVGDIPVSALLYVYDLNGKIVAQSPHNATVSVRHLPRGIYYIKIDGFNQVQKLAIF